MNGLPSPQSRPCGRAPAFEDVRMGLVCTSHSAPPRAVTPPSTPASSGTTSPYSGSRGVGDLHLDLAGRARQPPHEQMRHPDPKAVAPPLSGPSASRSVSTSTAVAVVKVIS